LSDRGFKEATLLGQNVNSYMDGPADFADLLKAVATAAPSMRIRFTTSHPHDMSGKLIETIASHSNLCKYIHLPVQSGSDRILSLMNRTYNRAEYLALIGRIRRAIPEASLSTDIISGFPTETEDDHRATVDLMKQVGYDGAFMFKYSPRENTPAFKMNDDVPDEIKSERVTEIIEMQNGIAHNRNQSFVGKSVEVLVEGPSKKSSDDWSGRTDGNKTVVFRNYGLKAGDYARVVVDRANSATLFGRLAAGAETGPCERMEALEMS
jgi:tRNA-2-methylthio-N6-dimethylallyladenosine synthase